MQIDLHRCICTCSCVCMHSWVCLDMYTAHLAIGEHSSSILMYMYIMCTCIPYAHIRMRTFIKYMLAHAHTQNTYSFVTLNYYLFRLIYIYMVDFTISLVTCICLHLLHGYAHKTIIHCTVQSSDTLFFEVHTYIHYS